MIVWPFLIHYDYKPLHEGATLFTDRCRDAFAGWFVSRIEDE